ncbi:hypothetical protein VTJ04DRAFT_912 [Mycothermus thermophilus]|uniref:uncharacterized protein n=1 Tax=Humicola insolens TaxID=85995 RepID=UPI00374396F5
MSLIQILHGITKIRFIKAGLHKLCIACSAAISPAVFPSCRLPDPSIHCIRNQFVSQAMNDCIPLTANVFYFALLFVLQGVR